MKKMVVVHVVIMIVAVIVGAMLAAHLNQTQKKLSTDKELLSGAPIGGMHKFASDVDWMLFINYLGSLQSVNENNRKEVADRLERLMKLDPNFDKVYQDGVLSLSVADPNKAVELLQKACDNPQLQSNWKIPFYAGFILTHHVKDDGNLANYKERAKRAADFFEMAIKRSGQTPEAYIVNSYVRALARAKGVKEDSLKYGVLEVLYEEWDRSKNRRKDGAGMEDYSVIPNLTERLVKAAQEAKASDDGNAELSKLVEKIKQKVLADQHLCEKCLTPYAPGDKFCSSCGTGVKPYGVCSSCGTVLKGNYCSNCGKKK